MKHIILILLALFMATGGAWAGKSQVQKIYIFGMAAAFTDTIVHFTPIMEVDSAWLNRKKDFLLGREEYSYQLRDYLALELMMPHRTCVVVSGKNKKKLEKKRAKMLKLYTEPPKGARHFDVRYIDAKDFRFKAVNMSATVEQQEQEEQEAKAAMKPAKKPKREKPGKMAGAGPGEGRRPPHGM